MATIQFITSPGGASQDVTDPCVWTPSPGARRCRECKSCSLARNPTLEAHTITAKPRGLSTRAHGFCPAAVRGVRYRERRDPVATPLTPASRQERLLLRTATTISPIVVVWHGSVVREAVSSPSALHDHRMEEYPGTCDEEPRPEHERGADSGGGGGGPEG